MQGIVPILTLTGVATGPKLAPKIVNFVPTTTKTEMRTGTALSSAFVRSATPIAKVRAKDKKGQTSARGLNKVAVEQFRPRLLKKFVTLCERNKN